MRSLAPEWIRLFADGTNGISEYLLRDEEKLDLHASGRDERAAFNAGEETMRKTLVGLTVFAMSCGGLDGTAPAQLSAVGRWNLSTINGTGLPFTVNQTRSNKSEVTGGSLSIVAGGSFTWSTTGRNTVNGVVSTDSSSTVGTFTTNGTAITLRSNWSGITLSGAFSANSLTLAEAGVTSVFTR